jgi:DNA mismatch endonuclease (patch repair protein)
MVANRRTGTGPERALRQELHRRGRRFRVDYAVRVPGLRLMRVDVAFPRKRLLVFVDGCFWHMCPEHATMPANNAEWWKAKLEGNRARDRRTDEMLARHGWGVARVWEHEDPEEAAERIAELVRRFRAPANIRSVGSDV